MKKIIYSLVIMIAAGSLFTSCIEQIEPVGILDMRTAKAEYIRALKDLRAADAEYTRALAAVEQANAAYRMAETAWMQEQVNNQKLLNEYQALLNEAQATENEVLAAEAALKIQKLGQLMEESALKHEATMIELQYKVEKAQYEYDMAMRDLAILAKNLSPEERLAVVEAAAIYGAMSELYADSAKKLNSWQAEYDKLAEKLKNYNSEKWDGEAMVNKVTYYEEKIAEEKENIKEYQEALDAIPEKDADIEAWAAAVEAYDAKINQLKQKEAQINYDWQVYEDNNKTAVKEFNERVAAFVEENWNEDGGKWSEPTDPGKAPDSTAYYGKNAASIAFPELIFKPGKAAYAKFQYLLKSYEQEAPNDTLHKIVSYAAANDTLYLVANQAMKAFVLGEAGKTEANVLKIKNQRGKQVTLEAFYGLDGAIDVLERDKVLKAYTPKDTAKAREARDKAQAKWEAYRDTLVAGIAGYKPYTDALAAQEQTAKDVADAQKNMVAAIKALQTEFDKVEGKHDVTENDSLALLNAFAAFGAAREKYLAYEYDDETDAHDLNYFRFASGKDLQTGKVTIDSIKFSELASQTKWGKIYYEYRPEPTDVDPVKFSANEGWEAAIGNIADQLLGAHFAAGMVDPIAVAGVSMAADSWQALYGAYSTDQPVDLDKVTKIYEGTSGTDEYVSPKLKEAKDAVLAQVVNFVKVYKTFWATGDFAAADTAGVNTAYDLYFAQTKAADKTNYLKGNTSKGIKGAEPTVMENLPWTINYTDDTFLKPTLIVSFAVNGADIDSTNAIGAVLASVDPKATSDMTGKNFFKVPDAIVDKTATAVFNGNATLFYKYMKAEYDYQQSFNDAGSDISQIKAWVADVKEAFEKDEANKTVFDSKTYNADVKKYNAKLAKWTPYKELKTAFAGTYVDAEGKTQLCDVLVKAKKDWTPTVGFFVAEPADIAGLFATDILGNYVGWDEEIIGGTQLENAKELFGEEAWKTFQAKDDELADVADDIAFATAEKEKANAVYVAAVKVKNLKDKDGNVIGGADMKAVQEAYDKAYEGFVKFYEGEIDKAEKAIADYQKAIINYQNGLTDLEAQFQSVSDKLETAKLEMGVIAEGLALAKSNYEAIMNYIKTESEGSLIIPVTLNEIMKVVDNLDAVGIDVSSLLYTVAGAVTSLL